MPNSGVSTYDCGPSSSYGSFDSFSHTLFLGLTIKSFTANVGWNDQVSQVTVSLVEDPYTSTNGKAYYDAGLSPQTTYGPDPGFIGDSTNIIGCPAYFRIGIFEFAGIIESYYYSESPSGRIYTVTVADPRTVLAGAQLITGGHAGQVGPIYNVFNVYGFAEYINPGVACAETYLSDINAKSVLPTPDKYIFGDFDPDGSVFGSDAAKFGGAQVNNSGMPWDVVAGSFNILANGFPKQANGWSPYGRTFYAGTAASGYGLVALDNVTEGLSEYFIDISELPSGAYSVGGQTYYWRIPGPNVSVLEAISNLCEVAGYDYYIELVLIRDSSLAPNSGIAKFIKVRAVDRTLQPSLGEIQAYLGSGIMAESYKQGRELRNETTSAMLIGGNKRSIYQIEQEEGDTVDLDIVIPHFGVKDNGDAIIPSKTNGKWVINVGTDKINSQLQLLVLPSTIDIEEREIQAAIVGQDEWLTWITTVGTDTGAVLGVADVKGLFNEDFFENAAAVERLLEKNADGEPVINVNELLMCGASAEENNAGALTGDVGKIYEWVSGYTKDYGTAYQVRVPYSCAYVDSETQQLIVSEIPVDSGWTEQEYVLGVEHPGIVTTTFTDTTTNQLQAFVRMDDIDTLNTSDYQDDRFLVTGNNLYIGCSVDSKYVFEDVSAYSNPRAVIHLSNPIYQSSESFDGGDLATARLLFYVMQAAVAAHDVGATDKEVMEAVLRIQRAAGGAAAKFNMMPVVKAPDAVAFGIESQVDTYGPWVSAGAVGQTSISKDDGLVPWLYNGSSRMNAAAQSIVNAGLTNMQVSEYGQVTLPGYPDIPLGAELGAVQGGYFAGQNLIENRSYNPSSVYGYGYAGFQYSGGRWRGTYGPNITAIDINADAGGVHTQYTMRTFTPRVGSTIAKLNADRLRESGHIAAGNLRSKEIQKFTNKHRAQIQERRDILSTRLAIIRKEKRDAEEEKKRNSRKSIWHNVLVGHTTSTEVA